MTVKSCGTVLYTSLHGKRYYLLIKGKDGNVGFPKGHIEANETETECALRETWEETSIIPKLEPRFQRKVQYKMMNGVHRTIVCFLGYFEHQQAAHQHGFEEFEYLLLSYKEAYQALTYKNTKDVLKDAESFLCQGWGEWML